MQYLISFLEGIITFISPCMLPMIPIYLTYFAAGDFSDANKNAVWQNALGFILGFSMVFTALGAFAASLGRFLVQYQTAVNIVSGIIIIIFGLYFMGVLRFNIFKGKKISLSKKTGPLFSVLFGITFSIAWTPCVGAFLGSALILASRQETVTQGVIMLLCYSAGLGIPFFLSALFLDRLKGAFNWIKSHYKVINIISGSFLILVGILMMTGTLSYLLGFLSV